MSTQVTQTGFHHAIKSSSDLRKENTILKKCHLDRTSLKYQYYCTSVKNICYIFRKIYRKKPNSTCFKLFVKKKKKTIFTLSQKIPCPLLMEEATQISHPKDKHIKSYSELRHFGNGYHNKWLIPPQLYSHKKNKLL